MQFTKKAALLLTVLSLLTSCANFPELGSILKPRADLLASESKPAYQLPSVNWWQAYGDAQLSRIISIGLQKSPNLTKARARILMAQGFLQQAGAKISPSFNASASAQSVKQSYNMSMPASAVLHGFNDQGKASLNFNYEFDFWGKNREFLQSSLSEFKAAELEGRQAQIMLAASITSTYAEIAQVYNELDSANEAVNVRVKTLKLFSARQAQGLEDKSVLERAKSNLAIAEADVASLQEALSLLNNSLLALMGEKPGSGIIINRPSLKLTKTLTTPEQVTVNLIASRPDVQACLMRAEAAANRINVARTRFYPDINFGAYVGQQSLGIENMFKKGSLIGGFGPAVNLPIFESNNIEGAYRIARGEYEKAVAEYESAVINALQEVSAAVISQKSLTSRIMKTKIASESSEHAHQLIKKRYQGGLVTYLDVLQVEDQLIASHRALSALRARSFSLDVALIKSLGGGLHTQNSGEIK